MKQIVNAPVSISIEPKTNFMVLKQGENEVKITKNDAYFIKCVGNGENPDSYVSGVTGFNFSTCGEEGKRGVLISNEENTVLLKKRKKADNDLKAVEEYVNKYRAKIAWDRDFRRR